MMVAVERQKYLDGDEVTRLRTVTQARAITDLAAGRTTGVVNWMVVDLALGTGLRVSEMARITHADIDLRRGFLRAWRMKRRNPSTETIALGKDLIDHLKEFIEWKSLVGQETGDDSPLLVGKRGPLTDRGLQQIWKSCCKSAGLPKELSIHAARHTLAVHLLAKTQNLRMV